jgi:hypothetical protein
MKEAKFIIISAPDYMNRFMKAVDLFQGKNLGITEEITVSYKKRVNLTLEIAGERILTLKEAFESANRIVSFVHLKQIQNGNIIILNDSILPFVDKKAREISNGHTSFVFKDFIETLTPFKCETDQNYYITKITLS